MRHTFTLTRKLLLFFPLSCLLLSVAGKPAAPKNITVSTGNYHNWDFAPSAVFGTAKIEDTKHRYYYKITRLNDTVVKVERYNPAGIILSKTVLYFLGGCISHLKQFNQWGEEFKQEYFTKVSENELLVTRRIRGENSFQPCKKARYIYNGNLLKETRYVDDSGAVCACSTGAAIIRYARYDDGNRYSLPKSIAHYNQADSPVVSAATDCFKTITEIDEKGIERSEKFIGPNGLPMPNRLGVYGYNYPPALLYNRYDEQCTGQGGEVINNLLGFATVEYVDNEDGFEIMETRFDKRYHITKTNLLGDGAAIIHYKRDSRGNEIERSFANEKDEPINNRRGFYKITSVYNDSNMLKEQSYFDSAGKPVTDAYDVHHYKYSKDSVGRLVAEKYFNNQDAPCKDNFDQVYECRFRYDGYGRRISTTYWNVNGQPMNRWNGYHESQIAYNDDGKPVKYTYLDENGQYVKTNTGYSVQKISYNRHGLTAVRSYFDGDIPVMLQGRGYIKNYHAISYSYDSENRVAAIDYLNNDDKPAEATASLETNYVFSRVEFLYEGNRIVKEKLYNATNELLAVIDCLKQQAISTSGNSNLMPNK